MIEYLPLSNEPLHLLRALLRECTYLPDATSRHVIAKHVLSRFRDYPAPRPGHADPVLTRERRAKIIVDARRGLSLLIRANDGILKPLLRTLLFTYGRIGKPRRELVVDLIRSDRPTDEKGIISLRRRGQSLKDLTQWPPMPGRLTALMESQASQKPRSLTRPTLRSTSPKIPELNIWLRPLPKKRERNMRYRFYSTSLHRILPPLAEAEWLRLRDLVLGKTAWSGSKPRRKRPILKGTEETLLTKEFLSSQLGQRKKIKRDSRPHNITPRAMRRLWGQVFAQCPVMRWDSGEGKWQIEWGKASYAVERFKERRIESGSLFSGVDEYGKMLPPQLEFAADVGKEHVASAIGHAHQERTGLRSVPIS